MVGWVFSLTASATGDLVTGTAGNDTITGGAGTISNADVIADATTTDADVANFTVSGSVGQVVMAKIETVNLGFDLASDIDLAKVSGATAINLSAATAGNTAATVKGLGASTGASALISGADIATLGIQGTASLTDSVKVTTKAATLALTESTTEIENIEVATSGTASTVTLDVVNTVTKTVVTGSGDKNLKIVESAAGEYDTMTINSNMATGAALTVKSIATATVDYSGVAAAATVELNGALTGATVTLNNTASNVLQSKAMAGATTLKAKTGSSNTLNLTETIDQAGAGDLTLSGYTTLNLTATQSDGTSWDTAGDIVASGVTINYSGATDANLTGTNTWSHFNAATATGKVNVLAAATAAKFTGGSGNDTVQLASDTSMTIVGGNGTDTLDINTAGNLTLDDNDVQLSSVEVIDVQGLGGTLTLAATQITGQTLTFLGAGNDDLVNVTMAATGATADLSNVSISGIVSGGGASQFSVTGGAGSDTIKGTKGADVLLGAAGADNITGGEGADNVTGGDGADTINLTETTAAIDTVIYTAASEYGDTVTNFAAGTGVDVVQFAKALAGSADTTLDAATAPTVSSGVITKSTFAVETSEAVLVSAAVNAATTTKAITAANLTDLTKVAAMMADVATFTDAGANTAETVLFVIEASDATTGVESFGVYSWTQGAAADVEVTATELKLVGTYSGTGTVALSDITLV